MAPEGTGQVGDPEYHSRNHTAVQPCGWTKKAITGDGVCYKSAFYGIASHRCVQMTPVVRCNERCVFCWRDHAGHAHALEETQWDDPEAVVEASIELQRKLLSGYGGNEEVDETTFEEAMDPQHVAISLDGEPTLYPYLPELIEAYHERDITTFLVSNGTRPTVLAECDPTQLYVSVDAPDRDTYNEVVQPMVEDGWDRLMDSLDVMAKTDTRTTIRTTLVEGHNDHDAAGYARLFERADPDFIELKAYMHVGRSRERLDRSAMPDHDRVVAFAKAVQEHLPAFDVMKASPPSRVVLLAREEATRIDGLDA